MANDFTLFSNVFKFGVLHVKSTLNETKLMKKSKILHFNSKNGQKF